MCVFEVDIGMMKRFTHKCLCAALYSACTPNIFLLLALTDTPSQYFTVALLKTTLSFISVTGLISVIFPLISLVECCISVHLLILTLANRA